MKIKKIFSVASIASLAILMSACSKNVKKESLYNADYFSNEAISISDYKDSIKQKEITLIASGKTYRELKGNILVLQDTDKYYFYNLKLEGKELFSVTKSDVYTYTINADSESIQIRYYANEDGDYAYELYSFEGNVLFEKTNVGYFNLARGTRIHLIVEGSKELTATPNVISYEIKENDSYVRKNVTYYICETESIYSDEESKEFLTDEEYYDKYGKIKDQEIDGTVYGLKGYTIRQYSNGKLALFKGEKLINMLSLNPYMSIISNGYILYQDAKIVSQNEDYDLFYDGVYLKVETFKMCLKNSEISKVKNFKYYITGIEDGLLVDGVAEGFYCDAIDFSKKKNCTDADEKYCLIKGNGNISIHDGTTIINGKIIDNNNEYYVYKEVSFHASGKETTALYDKKGNLKKVYDGIFYDNILAVKEDDSIRFTTSEGKTKFVLNDANRIDYSKYYGLDISGNIVLVEINNGELVITNINGYTVYEDLFLYKAEANIVSFYTLDSTITKVDFSYDTSLESITEIADNFYRYLNNDTDEVRIVYIG